MPTLYNFIDVLSIRHENMELVCYDTFMQELEEIRSKLGILGFTVVDATWGEINGFGAVPALYFRGDNEQRVQLEELLRGFYEAYPEPNRRYHLKIFDTETVRTAGFVLFAGHIDNFEELTTGESARTIKAEELHEYRKQFLNLGKYLATLADSSIVASPFVL